MVVSFTISNNGKRYRPQPRLVEEDNINEEDQDFHGDESNSTQTQTHVNTLNQNEVCFLH